MDTASSTILMGDGTLDNVIEINRTRTFSLQDARRLLPLVFRMTEDSSREVKTLLNRVEAFADKTHPSVASVESRINFVIERWQQKMEKLGVEPKGLWMADFDNGEGYFCWKYPETEINYWHGYQDGYSGRILVE